ncbi:MAG: phosphatidylserine decarboxylase [Oscillospiraceae bacterium]|nr:phosphatidylserine decarboxylase [Oscillospiraceae bacterium]
MKRKEAGQAKKRAKARNAAKKESTGAVRFFYGTRVGRVLLRGVMRTHADRLAVFYLRSRASKPFIRWYAKRNGVALTRRHGYRSFREFFIRTRDGLGVDTRPEHLISPCDGYLSACRIYEDSSFTVKGKRYRLGDLLQDETLAKSFHGGDCLIIRLTPSDYHHYCYIDDGVQGENHFIEGELHSVQSAACERYPVYTLNRRCWTLLETERFGPVVQTEVGALVVGGIVNDRENAPFRRGEEMGHFELAGSTVVLMFQRDRIALEEPIARQLAEGGEYRVRMGMCLGSARLSSAPLCH